MSSTLPLKTGLKKSVDVPKTSGELPSRLDVEVGRAKNTFSSELYGCVQRGRGLRVVTAQHTNFFSF